MNAPPLILIVGVGSIGERHARCFLNTGRADVAICETITERRQEVANRYNLSKYYGDFEQALSHSNAQAAVIASPAPTHIPMARQAAEAGLHLLIEKPLSLSLEGVEELAAVVSAQQLIAATAYCWRCHPLLDQAYQFLQSSPYGRPLEIVCQSGQCFPYYRPAYKEIYYRDRASGGGAIQDAITHMLNTGEWFGGPIRQVAADARHQQLPDVEVEDTVHVLTRQGLDGDVMGGYCLNQYQPANEVNWSLVYEGGVVRIEVGRHRWMRQDDPAKEWEILPHPPLDRDAMYLAQAHNFLDALEGDAPPRCTLEDGWQTLKANLAVLAAVDQGLSMTAIKA